MKIYDLVIVGGGPAGLSAAIYAKRAALDFVLIESEFINGGQMLNTSSIDNYPGFAKIDGASLAERMTEHVNSLGVETVYEKVEAITKEEGAFSLLSNGNKILTKSVIIASGARHSKLGIPGEDEFSGMGVSYCATCDGAFFEGKTVAVVGGGNTALEEALFLSKICKKAYLIHRRDELRGAVSLQKKVEESQNIDILYSCEVKKIEGCENVTNILIYDKKNKTEFKKKIDGIFISVGIVPNTEFCKDIVTRDNNGFIIAGEDCKTDVPGIFAAGDVRNKPLRQIVTAVSDGASSVSSAEKYLRN